MPSNRIALFFFALLGASLTRAYIQSKYDIEAIVSLGLYHPEILEREGGPMVAMMLSMSTLCIAIGVFTLMVAQWLKHVIISDDTNKAEVNPFGYSDTELKLMGAVASPRPLLQYPSDDPDKRDEESLPELFEPKKSWFEPIPDFVGRHNKKMEKMVIAATAPHQADPDVVDDPEMKEKLKQEEKSVHQYSDIKLMLVTRVFLEPYIEYETSDIERHLSDHRPKDELLSKKAGKRQRSGEE